MILDFGDKQRAEEDYLALRVRDTNFSSCGKDVESFMLECLSSSDSAVRTAAANNLTLPAFELLKLVGDSDALVSRAASESLISRQTSYKYLLEAGFEELPDFRDVFIEADSKATIHDDLILIDALMNSEIEELDFFVVNYTDRRYLTPYDTVFERLKTDFYSPESYERMVSLFINGKTNMDVFEYVKHRDFFSDEQRRSIVDAIDLKVNNVALSVFSSREGVLSNILWGQIFNMLNEDPANKELPLEYQVRLAKVLFIRE